MVADQYKARLKELLARNSGYEDMAGFIDELVAEETRKLRQQRDQSLYYLDEADVMLVALDREGVVTFANDTICQLTGYARDELLGHNWFDVMIPPEHKKRVITGFKMVMSGDSQPSTHFENWIVVKNGMRRLIMWHNTYNRDLQTGEITGAISSGQDITIRRGMEDALHQNELRYRQMFYTNNAIKLVINPQTGDIMDANEAACEFYGYTYEQLTAMNIGQINVMSIQELVERDGMDPTVRGVYRYQHRIASGDIREVEVYTGPLTLDDEELRFSVILDVTEREQAKRDLQIRESQLQAIVSHFPGGMLMFDTEKRAIVARGQLHLDGMSSLEMLEGDYLPDVLPKTIWESADTMYDDALNGKSSLSDLEYGGRQFIEQVSPVYDDQQNLIGGLHLIQDVTDLHQSKQLLQQTRAQLDTILDGIVDGVAIITNPRRLVYANETAAKMVGYESVEQMTDAMQEGLYVVYETLDEHGNHLKFEDQAIYHALQGEIPPAQTVIFTDPETNKAIWIDTKANPIFDSDGSVRFVVVIMTDTTRARDMEQFKLKALQEQAQIETLRKYIANTTHDLAQPLSVINTSVYMLDKSIQDERVQKRTDAIRTQATRMQTILQDIQQISVLDTLTDLPMMLFNMNQMIEAITSHFQPQCDERHIKLVVLDDAHQAEIIGNPQYIERALKQVVQNAIDYSKQGCEVRVRSFVAGDNYVVEIKDTGIGIPEKDLEHVQDRFYRADESRTASTHSGTGLGLSITRRIMELHGGDLKIESEEGIGTTVQLVFPANHEG